MPAHQVISGIDGFNNMPIAIYRESATPYQARFTKPQLLRALSFYW
jgi:hypothetical protein